MRVTSLTVNNLRNIRSARLEPASGLNCLIGDNGAGKTSVLEALVVLSKGRSFRSGQISSLIGIDGDTFQVIASIVDQKDVRHQLGLERGADHWFARVDGEDVRQRSVITSLLPYVMLEPESHALVSGPPEGRRKYLDWGVFHVKHAYLTVWRRYSRTLKQRNAALRNGDMAVVSSLDQQFVELGEQIHREREKTARVLAELLVQKLPLFNPSLDGIGLDYRKGWSGEGLDQAIGQSLQRDRDRGATGPGPHKADLYLSLHGAPARDRVSRGEQKALTAAMVMAQAELICQTGEKPLLLLDDLSSELDENHLGRVLKASLALEAQIWLTGTRLSTAVTACGADHVVFHVKHGRILEK